MDEISFENTNNEVEHTRWYAVAGAPPMQHQLHPEQTFQPSVVKWTFKDGDPTGVFMTVHPIKKDGEPSERYQQMPGLYIWNQQEWPEWLHDLYKIACAEHQDSLKVAA